ncbi:hypothetical protein DYBT9623_01544 [Dyadobacter sp. CECT 9623]|uniref:Uncharacterized protein n=1 Tax=Dyadobacter linearis TaxID=2823330 RepID=A0ABM8UMX8_9BACT|nr:hypothetical protein [Dyadobacter sp. CECT 9623]CAG5068812.1 hypothetical protein DYBT9623_01544 [Dyadobacter sp. CECT 9623]
MKTLHYTIVSEEMVWLWYYDELHAKHFKELLDYDARTFIKELNASGGDLPAVVERQKQTY